MRLCRGLFVAKPMLLAFLQRFNLRLVDDARNSWKWSSMRLLALGGVTQTAVVSCPAAIAQHVPEWVWQALSCFSLFCIIAAGVGRITTTEKPDAHVP